MGSIELRLPNISGSEKEQLIQIRSYLYQIIPQLQWALNNVNATDVTSETIEQIAKKIGSTAVTTSKPSSVDANISFEKLKPLIRDSAEIVMNYYDKIIEKLNAIYFAESNFGTFIEETNRITETTAQYTDDKFKSTQVLIAETNASVEVVAGAAEDLSKSVRDAEKAISDTNAKVDATTGEVEGLKEDAKTTTDTINDLNAAIENAKEDIGALNVAIVEATGNIRSGELYRENGIPVYGLEVGQKVTINGVEEFNKFARFIANRLSFYDQNGNEVAYISDYKLYISNAEVTGTLKLGGFLVDTSKGLTIKWAGRG